MTTLPGGTVTFVFTDIEGSTRLLQELGDDYAGVARDHRRLVRDAFVARGGNEIDTQGDSFFFSFPRARDAVSAAVDAQRSLRDPAGEQHLKDIQHEHIYEISVDGAPVGARPLKTTAPEHVGVAAGGADQRVRGATDRAARSATAATATAAAAAATTGARQSSPPGSWSSSCSPWRSRSRSS